ncbi:hypothetical protein DV096_16710 [Bradymonadaceae bacterium TMQ3]|nr:hypothetical protein DV096_16710 [Bradymonadaceae bacterium TMQ3]TXC69352.1 hypothetical protein FRC91_17290 [Bradymonadales bacterium TMQ1]
MRPNDTPLMLPLTGVPDLIHLSDLHLRDDESLRRLRRLVQAIATRHGAARKTVVVLTGDIVDTPDRALWREAETLVALLQDAGVAVVGCPGNHDVGWMGLGANAGDRAMAQRWFTTTWGAPESAKAWPREYGAPGLTLLLCDTTVGENTLATGQLGYTQRMALAAAAQRAKARGDQVVVAMHHHPVNDDASLKLHDAEALLHLLASRCDVLLCGHLHQASAWSGVWGIGRIYAADAAVEAQRYRHLSFQHGRWLASWVRP